MRIKKNKKVHTRMRLVKYAQIRWQICVFHYIIWCMLHYIVEYAHCPAHLCFLQA
jgi:hypothetical protein